MTADNANFRECGITWDSRRYKSPHLSTRLQIQRRTSSVTRVLRTSFFCDFTCRTSVRARETHVIVICLPSVSSLFSSLSCTGITQSSPRLSGHVEVEKKRREFENRRVSIHTVSVLFDAPEIKIPFRHYPEEIICKLK